MNGRSHEANLAMLPISTELTDSYLVGDYSGLSYSLPTTLKTQAFPGTGYTPLKSHIIQRGSIASHWQQCQYSVTCKGDLPSSCHSECIIIQKYYSYEEFEHIIPWYRCSDLTLHHRLILIPA